MACVDAYDRPIDYLRLSVTDRCNLRCVYCMPEGGVPWRPHAEILTFEEMERIVRAAAHLGITKIRLTGGEPLVRHGIVQLVQSLAAVPGIEDLAMTSNGVLLPKYARELAQAGLTRVNVSLDTLRPDRFARITRLGRLEDTLAGIQAAVEAGLTPVKLNMVVIRGENDDEVVDMARRTQTHGWHVRFIECMPVGDTLPVAAGSETACGLSPTVQSTTVTVAEITERITTALGPLVPAAIQRGNGPARYYALPGAHGTIGFISPISQHFCHRCNRLRVTADGRLRPCLLSDLEIDLRSPLRSGAGLEEMVALLRQGVRQKPDRHHLAAAQAPAGRTMSQIGG